jgi:hypothetical protein
MILGITEVAVAVSNCNPGVRFVPLQGITERSKDDG